MNLFVKFMASTAGRILRIVAGLALVTWGLAGLGGAAGIVIAMVGLVPLLAGIFDFCIFAPLFGAPLSGPKIRSGSLPQHSPQSRRGRPICLPRRPPSPQHRLSS